jgi:hypothetical protein
MSMCMCGAEDCPRCFPCHYDRGIYLETTCEMCGGGYLAASIQELEDGPHICPDCEALEEENQ